MNKHRSGIVPRDALDSMSTAMLQELLDRELEVESPADVNVERIKEITTILNARTGKSKIDVDAKYNELISEHLMSEMLYSDDEKNEDTPVTPLRSRKRFGRILLIAAVLVVLFAGMVQVSGLNIWKALAQWTEETFKFDMAVNAPERTISDTEVFDELRWSLAADGVTATLVPWYMPDGYVFDELTSDNGEYCARYVNGEKVLHIQIRAGRYNTTRIEKNDTMPEIYIVNGIEHHIVSNLERNAVTWVNEGYECIIFGIPSMEDAYKMIDSIYWED